MTDTGKELDSLFPDSGKEIRIYSPKTGISHVGIDDRP